MEAIKLSQIAGRLRSEGKDDVAGRLDDLRRDVEAFVEEFVLRYQRDKVRERKTIHSAPFGSQSLRDYEVALLDTPLLQRLRQIRQTGFAFLTFPTSLHTRFEHTLGTLRRSHELCTVLAERYEGDGKWKPEYTVNIRLAALLHDCAHGPFSHSSDEVMAGFPEMQALRGPNCEFEGCQPHEILGYLILTSDPFKEFMGRLSREYEIRGLWPVEDIAALLVARLKDPELFFANQIINGALDADKLDYMIRDGFFAGLAVALDMDRLWQALELQRHDGRQGLVVSLAGLNPVRDMISAKFTLYLSLYKHHKLRACDCMYKGILEYLRSRNAESPAADGTTVPGPKPLLFGRAFDKLADFLWFTDDVFFSAALDLDRQDPLHCFIHDIRYRRPLRRALTICKLSVESGWEGFFALLCNHWDGGEKEVDLREIAREIHREAGAKCLPEQVWLDLPRLPDVDEGPNVMVNIGTPAEPVLCPFDDIIRAEDFTKDNAYHSWRGHVFCPYDCRAAVAEAAEKVLGRRFGISFNHYARQLSHST